MLLLTFSIGDGHSESKDSALEETFLLPQKGNYLVFNFVLECQSAVVLQVHRQFVRKHDTLPVLLAKGDKRRRS
jgi:hypothetical protein